MAEELRAISPDVHVDYAADAGFFPYGDKEDAQLTERLPEVASALVGALDPDVFVIACNTASTLALPEIRERLTIPVVGTVPAIKPAARLSKTGTIGLLATPGTIRREYTAALISDFAQDVDVLLHGSVDLVTLAEAVARGETPSEEDFAAAQAPLFAQDRANQMDVIVLACTHFPLIKTQLQATAPKPVTYIDSGEAIARQTGRILASRVGDVVVEHIPRAMITDDPTRHPGLVEIFQRYGFANTEAFMLNMGERSVASVSSAGTRTRSF